MGADTPPCKPEWISPSLAKALPSGTYELDTWQENESATARCDYDYNGNPVLATCYWYGVGPSPDVLVSSTFFTVPDPCNLKVTKVTGDVNSGTEGEDIVPGQSLAIGNKIDIETNSEIKLEGGGMTFTFPGGTEFVLEAKNGACHPQRHVLSFDGVRLSVGQVIVDVAATVGLKPSVATQESTSSPASPSPTIQKGVRATPAAVSHSRFMVTIKGHTTITRDTGGLVDVRAGRHHVLLHPGQSATAHAGRLSISGR